MKPSLVIAGVVVVTACAAPAPSDLLVPQDGVHVSGTKQAFIPATPAGSCRVDSQSNTLNYVTLGAGPKGLDITIGGYHGVGSYAVTKVSVTGVSPPSTTPPTQVIVYTQGAAWVADSGSVAVVTVGVDGSIHGTINVPKAWSKGSGPSGPTSSIQGTWSCDVPASPSPVIANG